MSSEVKIENIFSETEMLRHEEQMLSAKLNQIKAKLG